jgi:hypothetical protein
MRTNHPGSAALNFTASNLTLLRFSLAIGHLCGKRVCVASTHVACRIETASLSRMPDNGRRHLAPAERAARALFVP